MDAPQFILYFSAVSGFTSWVQGIMENVAQIRQSGVGISDVMELISYEEPYRFEDGEPLPKNAAGQYELRLENVEFPVSWGIRGYVTQLKSYDTKWGKARGCGKKWSWKINTGEAFCVDFLTRQMGVCS